MLLWVLAFVALDDIYDRPDPFDTLFFLLTGKEEEDSSHSHLHHESSGVILCACLLKELSMPYSEYKRCDCMLREDVNMTKRDCIC